MSLVPKYQSDCKGRLSHLVKTKAQRLVKDETKTWCILYNVYHISVLIKTKMILRQCSHKP